jgi:glycosyltransferase involved in cell wall biosynthesis
VAVKVGLHVDQLWFSAPGGIGTYVRELWARLGQTQGIDVVPFRSSWPADRRVAWTVPMGGGVTTGRHTTHYPLWDLAGRPALPRSLAGCDVIHATNHVAVPPARPGQALVATVHDLAFERFPEAFPARWRWLYRAGVRAACRRADAILVPSRATADDLAARHDLDPSKVAVIPLAGSTPIGPGDPEATLAELGIPQPFVLFVGTLEPRKNVVRLLRAHRRIGSELPHGLVLAGPVGWRTAAIDAELRSAGDRVVATGSVSPERLDALYRGADALCYPSLYEGFGLPVLEAMERGTPVVASTTRAVAEVAGDAALLVEPTDEEAIAAAIRRVLTDPSLADDLRRRGPERAAGFSWDRTAAATVEAYRSAVGRAS